MRTVSTTLHTSKKIVSASARLSGRTVRVVGKTAKRTIKLPAATVKKVKLMKQKLRHLNKAVAKDKLKKAAAASGKYIVKSAKFTVKSAAKAAGNAADRLTDSIDNDTVRFAKQSYNAARSAASAAKKAGKATGKTIKTSAKTVRTLATKKGRRELAKSVRRRVGKAKRNINRAKAVTKAAAKSTKLIGKVAIKVVGKLFNLIISTAPWSLIIIGAIALIIISASMVAQFATSAVGTVAGGGAWLLDDNSSQTPEEIYECYNNYKTLVDEVIQSNVKDKLKDKVTAFCNSDTSKPRKIIQFIGENQNSTFFPASGNADSVNSFIEAFELNDHSDFMSSLFVLMTREKQQADGVTDAEMYDFDFTKADFEELIKTVDENTCRFGKTFIYKTATETTDNACPRENCKTKKERGCKCGGNYCKGHPYCPHNHIKLTVKLYTVKGYSEIYGFTDNEKIRFETSKAFVKSLLDYWEGGE